MCGIIVIGVRAIVEAERPASFLKKLILVQSTVSMILLADAQADPGICYPDMPEDTLSHGAAVTSHIFRDIFLLS